MAQQNPPPQQSGDLDTVLAEKNFLRQKKDTQLSKTTKKAISSDNHLHLPYLAPYPRNPMVHQSNYTTPDSTVVKDESKLQNRYINKDPREALPIWFVNKSEGNFLPAYWGPRQMDNVEQAYPSMRVSCSKTFCFPFELS